MLSLTKIKEWAFCFRQTFREGVHRCRKLEEICLREIQCSGLRRERGCHLAATAPYAICGRTPMPSAIFWNFTIAPLTVSISIWLLLLWCHQLLWVLFRLIVGICHFDFLEGKFSHRGYTLVWCCIVRHYYVRRPLSLWISLIHQIEFLISSEQWKRKKILSTSSCLIWLKAWNNACLCHIALARITTLDIWTISKNLWTISNYEIKLVTEWALSFTKFTREKWRCLPQALMTIGRLFLIHR